MTRLEEIKAKSDIVVSWVSLLGVAAAVIFGLTQYRSDVASQFKDTERTTLAFIARYSHSEMLSARSSVQQSIDHLARELRVELENVRSVEAINIRSEEFYKVRAIEKLRSEGAYLDTQLIIRFFDELWVCVDVGLCDRPSAERFFIDEAYQYHFVLRGEIERIQLTRPRFGRGLQELRTSAPD